MIPSPITSALSALQAHRVPCLLMGGQACVLYGGAEFSRDLDLVIATNADALAPLRTALAALQAEVTQRDKDWATIGQLVEADMVRHRRTVTPERVLFWLQEARQADQLVLLAATYPDAATTALATRPLLTEAIKGDRETLELELAQEQIRGKAADRAYWAALLAELEEMRRAQRRADR